MSCAIPRTVDGEDTCDPAVVPGLVPPTFTEFSVAGSFGYYTTPSNCIGIEVLGVGGGGGGAGGDATVSQRNGGGGGAGGAGIGFFQPGTYAYTVGTGGAGGATGVAGITGLASRFDALSVGGGAPGKIRSAVAVVIAATANASATNSAYFLGASAAGAPGFFGANGGATFIKGYAGVATNSTSVNTAGGAGVSGGGGAGGNGVASGGAGGGGYILVTEYY